MISKIDKNTVRQKRHARVRKTVTGTADTPRMNVYRSLNHIYVQIIDDTKGVTLASASTMEKAVKEKIADMTKNDEGQYMVDDKLVYIGVDYALDWTDGDTLKAFEMNIFHYEPFSTVYGGAAKQQRRYEQLFHRHRYYAFFLTNSHNREKSLKSASPINSTSKIEPMR